MADKDLYATLGVSKTASADEIKSAFRNKAKQYHPDIYQGDKKEAEEKFKEIGEAYKILSDPDQRAVYDRVGYEGLRGRGGAGGGYGGFSGDFDMSDIFGDFGDIFGDVFGFGGSRSGSSRGQRRRGGEDLRYDLSVDFEEAAKEFTHTVVVKRKEACKSCHGEKIKPGTSYKTCKTCGGQGRVRSSQGFFSMVTTCPQCRGEGKTAEHLCSACGGGGYEVNERVIEVKIPAGVSNGAYLKLSGEGHAGTNGGRNGDLFVVINVRKHDFFEREEDDVILHMPVPLTSAVLGDEIDVPGIYGAEKLKINAATQNNDVYLIKGKGFPHLNSSRKGDMRVIISVEVPLGLNSKLKELYKSVKLSETEDNYPACKKAARAAKKNK